MNLSSEAHQSIAHNFFNCRMQPFMWIRGRDMFEAPKNPSLFANMFIILLAMFEKLLTG
jgi:hypothetical protein